MFLYANPMDDFILSFVQKSLCTASLLFRLIISESKTFETVTNKQNINLYLFAPQAVNLTEKM